MKRLDIRNKIYILFIFCIAIPLALRGQSSNTIIDKMNDVKLDESFIYGEGFNINKDIAYDNAMSDLLSYANEIRFEDGNKEKITTADLQPIVKQLIHFDGNQYDILVYIQKNQILSMVGHQNNQKYPSAADSKYENKEPVVQNKLQTSSIPKDAVADERTPLANDILETLCNQDNWTEIKGFLSTYKNQGRIKEFGFSTNTSDIPMDSYRILIDEQYGILAILAPNSLNNGINIKTNQIDKESNYPNYKVIVWFK